MNIIGVILLVLGLIIVCSYFENGSKKKSKDLVVIGIILLLIGGGLIFEDKRKEEMNEYLNRQAQDYQNNQNSNNLPYLPFKNNSSLNGLNDYRYRCNHTGCWCKITRQELENKIKCPNCSHPTSDHK
jgi:hypothetical protein